MHLIERLIHLMKEILYHEKGHNLEEKGMSRENHELFLKKNSFPNIHTSGELYKQAFNQRTAPTKYGRKDYEEDFAESFMIMNTASEERDREREYSKNRFLAKDVPIKDLKSYNERRTFFEKVFPDIKHQKSVREVIEEKEHPQTYIQKVGETFIPEEPKKEDNWREIFTGASVSKQKEWQEKPQEEKITERITEPDADKDSVPNEYDCEPENPEKQESPKMMLYRKGQLKDMLKNRYPNDYDKGEGVDARFDSGLSARENKRIILGEAQHGMGDIEILQTGSPQDEKPYQDNRIQKMRELEEKEVPGNIEKHKDTFDMRSLKVYDVDLPEYMIDQESFDAEKLERF
jgi:hypothetical protein